MVKDDRRGGRKEREIEIRRGRSREKHETHEPRFQKKRFFINNNSLILHQKLYSFGKTNALRRAIRDFSQGNDSFSEAWERFMALTRRCPHHGIPSWELVQTFYGGLNDNERNMMDIASGGNFVETYADESMEFMEKLVDNLM